MKHKYAHYLIVATLGVAVMVSCTDDPAPDEAGMLTEENYAYEGGIYGQYLTGELDVIQERVDSLQAVMDNNQGDDKTQAELSAALDEKSALNAQLEGIVSLAAIDRPIPIPRPPDPCQEFPATCFPLELDYIVCSDGLKSLEIKIYGDKGQLIASTSKAQLNPVPGVPQLQFQQIVLDPEYTGAITLDVARVGADNKVINYQTQGYISD